MIKQDKSSEQFLWVVGIGASAGGLEALGELVSWIPIDLPVCFVVAQHLAPHAKSMMVELVAKHAKIRVEAASNGRVLEPGVMLIIPPNFDVDVGNHQIILTQAGEETRPKPSVDRLLSSLAKNFGSRSIAVILSGTGSDGAEGVRAVRFAGGSTIVQDGKTAKYDGMPNAAIDTGQVDFILSPKEMATKFAEIIHSRGQAQSLSVEENDPNFRGILKLIRRDLGTDFSQYKMNTLKRRLSKRMAHSSVKTLADYFERLQNDAKELEGLSQDLLVSVSSFFRDQDAFSAAIELLSETIEKKPDGEEMRIWSAGCATGEEPYTLAMILCDLVSATNKRIPIKIFATDLDFDAIAHARMGVYSEQDIYHLPSTYVERYLERRGDNYEVKKRIRDLVVFARQDMIQNPPFVKLDFISCRNVLIYFETDLQAKVFEIFHYALRPGGYLFLGKSETVSAAPQLFDVLDRRQKTFVRKNVVSKLIPKPLQSAYMATDLALKVRKPISTLSLVEKAQTQILAQSGLSGAVVDEEGRIQTIIGNARAYLKLTAGMNEFLLQNLLPQPAGIELQIMIRKSLKTSEVQKSRVFRLDDDGTKKKKTGLAFIITVSLLEDHERTNNHQQTFFLVYFSPFKVPVLKTNIVETEIDRNVLHRLNELEQELNTTREHLQTVIEELGVSNEELQSVNEELSSTNEELQSSNEELETTNEELQATNEELTTVNEELNAKSSELRLANTALENIQSSINVPLLVIDKNKKLLKYNPSSNELFDISSSDLRRAIGRVSCRAEIVDFENKVTAAIQQGKMQEGTVETPKAIYQMRIMPSRNEVNEVDGAVIVFINNTELIRAEERWRHSENRIRAIINGSSSIIFLKDTMGKYLTVNKAFLNYISLSESDVIGKTDREILPNEVANQLRNADLEVILIRDRIERHETLVINGDRRIFLMSRFPLLDESGLNPIAIGTVAVDITAQVAAQEEVRKSEALYKAVVEDQSVFVCRYLPEGRIRFVNHAFCNYFGGRQFEYVDKLFSDVIDKEDQQRAKKEINRLGYEQQVVQIEHRYTRASDQVRWVRWINKAICSDDGTLLEIQAVGFDVTEYRQQTEQMIQREMLFSSIFNYTTDFLTVFRVVGSEKELILESFNRTVEQGTGYSYAHYIGRSVYELIDPKHRDEIITKYRTCVETKTAQMFDEELSLPGGIKYLSTSLVPIVNQDGEVERVVAVSRDISRFKQAEIELKNAKDEADVANQSKSDFLASMSHELRSPLNVVIGMSQLLQMADVKPEELRQIQSIYRSGKVLLSLVEDILDLSKIEAGKIKLEYSPFSVTEIISETMEPFQNQAAEKHLDFKYEVHLDEETNYVGDSIRLRQVLTNLLGNAIKFTDKGKVTLKVTRKPHTYSQRRFLRFEIIDTGIGIPKESQGRLFNKFSQVDTGLGRKFGGSGLGLSICKRLVTLMGGDIGCTSEWGSGSQFWFELPLSLAPGVGVKKDNNRVAIITPVPTEQSARVLAVDDSPDSLNVLGCYLQRLGHQAELVESGFAAVEVTKKQSFDLIFMDVQMPGMDGFQATAMIRKQSALNREIPIIALTANAMVGDSERCFEAGMNDYLTKPYEADTLKRVIDKWVRTNA